jgi:hypothetical protein
MLSSVPFAPGPSILRLHPRFANTLLLASAGGAFTLADAQGMSGGWAQGEGRGRRPLLASKPGAALSRWELGDGWLRRLHPFQTALVLLLHAVGARLQPNPGLSTTPAHLPRAPLHLPRPRTRRGAAAAMYQVETEGDLLVCAAISGSGECLAFGGSGGYVHLWAPSPEPSVNQMRQVGGEAGDARVCALLCAGGGMV